ncbi:MAG: tetratricopeptide repeat protein, partial [Maribacter sp.]
MELKQSKMWSYIILGCAIMGAFALFMEKQKSADTGTNRHNESKDERSEIVKNLDTIKAENERGFQEVLEALNIQGQTEKLNILLGDDFKQVLLNTETFNQLKTSLEGMPLNEFIYENELLKKQVEKLEISQLENVKNSVYNLISKLKYKSARRLIDDCLNEGLIKDPKILAQLLSIKSETFSFNSTENLIEFENTLKNALELDGNNLNVNIKYGVYLDAIGDYKSAKKHLFKADSLLLKTDLNYNHIKSNIYQYLGNTTNHLGDTKKSIEYLNLALEYDQSHSYNIYLLIGQIERNIGNIPSAIANFNTAISQARIKLGEINGISAMAFTGLSACYLQRNEFKRASMISLKAINYIIAVKGENHMHTADAYNNYANTLIFIDVEKAIINYEKALEITKSVGRTSNPPEMAFTYMGLSNAHLIKGKVKEAI